MEDYYYYYNNNRSGGGATHVPAFGSWDWNSDLPFTQCFESARQAGLLRFIYPEDRDLYVAGDLYENDVCTPAMIVVPRIRAKASKQRQHAKKEKQNWKVSDEVMEPASPQIPVSRPTRKPVDEDLYKISPHLLHSKSKKKGVLGLVSSQAACCQLVFCEAAAVPNQSFYIGSLKYIYGDHA